MIPCTVRFASKEELAELAKIPRPKKEPNYDRSPMFRRRGKNAMRIAGTGWQMR